MDTASIVAICLALIAAVPGIITLYNQGKKDKVQVEIDRKRAEAEVAAGVQASYEQVLNTIKSELSRLQAKQAEMEAILTDKNTLIANLQQAVFDKDVKIRTLQFAFDGLKMRLETVENNAAISPEAKRLLKKLRLEQEAEVPAFKAQAIQEASAELGMESPPCAEP